MKPQRRRIAFWSTLLLAFQLPGFMPLAKALDTAQPADALTQPLFDEYILKPRHNTSEVDAAAHLIARRARCNGFWKAVVSELERKDPNTQTPCLKIIGEMLEDDADARDVNRLPLEVRQTLQGESLICLSPAVVARLITAGTSSEFDKQLYVITLVRARAPQSIEFFRSLLKENGKRPQATAIQFFAAAGLAQLGDPLGFDWLIANLSNKQSIYTIRVPQGFTGNALNIWSLNALVDISRQTALSSSEEWQHWISQQNLKTHSLGHLRFMK